MVQAAAGPDVQDRLDSVKYLSMGMAPQDHVPISEQYCTIICPRPCLRH